MVDKRTLKDILFNGNETEIAELLGPFEFDAWWNAACKYTGECHASWKKIELKHENGTIVRGFQKKPFTQFPRFTTIGYVLGVMHDKKGKIKHVEYYLDRYPFVENLCLNSGEKHIWMIYGRVFEFHEWAEILAPYKPDLGRYIDELIRQCKTDNKKHEYYGVTDEQLVRAKLKYA